MLTKAGELGVPIQIFAQGQAVVFVLAAVETAKAPPPKRIVGAGVRLSDIKPRTPRKLVTVWVDPNAVPPALNVEDETTAFERDPGYLSWEKILIQALAGAGALRPREIPKTADRFLRPEERTKDAAKRHRHVGSEVRGDESGQIERLNEVPLDWRFGMGNAQRHT
ncbi:MAG: hypothetical protein COB53_02865 [Elusimicrobia bacterium]|nr:MAG: hypothetical protein COB53_02865 [Elusimicrobiota bacterium]